MGIVMQNVAVICQPHTKVEQMRARLECLADELDAMGQHFAAAHVSMATDHLFEARPQSKPNVD
ncbi:hypothetical protein [Altericroceibacterium xinjiangense]|uniref:hypothetical protein n=1 Tax=Altericroceibacterium xinjiangense TaxID=762261 RepID=UPI000F7FA46A|nr:hypothetical protein [Altericroceibacterium xinjiangense]